LESDHEGQAANAAVALLLQIAEHDLRVLVVKRVENPSDAWSGQMALPGGKRDAKDRDLKDTVIREVAEEININVRAGGRFLGVLPPQQSKRRPDLTILPFVILLEQEPAIRVKEGEVDLFLWASLNDLVHKEASVTFSFGERPAYTLGQYVVWGLTYNILHYFIDLLTSPANRTQRFKGHERLARKRNARSAGPLPT
jgi:8-oxo-dGTP diphosphatase